MYFNVKFQNMQVPSEKTELRTKEEDQQHSWGWLSAKVAWVELSTDMFLDNSIHIPVSNFTTTDSIGFLKFCLL